jgi:branched-chain amino acid transport system substrate-binding protein
MRLFRMTAISAVAALASLAPCAFAQQGVTDTEVVIGDILPLSGPPALLGIAHNLGVKVAVAEVNAQGGINGRKIRLISEDDGYVISRTLQGLRKLINSDKVFALTSLSGSTQGQAALPLIKESGIPVITTISFAVDAYKPVVKNVFALGTLHPLVTGEVVKQMAARYPNKKWAIVTQDDEYGELTRHGFEEAQNALKLDVVSTAVYKKGQTDFSAEMLKVKQAGAEVLYAGGLVSENVAMAKELERQGLKTPLGMSYVTRVAATLKLMGTAGANVFTADYVEAEESARGKAFLQKAKNLLSEDEFKRTNRFTMSGYAGARVMFEAMRRCGKALTFACTITQLEAMKDFDTGVTSPVSFSPTSHLSVQKLQLLKGNPSTLSFDPVQ